MEKIVISDLDHANIDAELDVFKQHSIEFNPDSDWRAAVSDQDIIDTCGDAAVLCIQYGNITRRVMESLPNLKQIVRYGVGYDTVDVVSAKELGVEVCNVPDYGTSEVADHAVALTLWLHRKLYMTNRDIRNGRWNYIDTIPVKRLSETTVGIIGLGRIGTAYATRMHAFGSRIIAEDDRLVAHPNYVTMVSLEKLLQESDIISIHCPADHAQNLIGSAEFAQMKPDAILINVSRGGIVDEDALEVALATNQIAGCGLDVAKNEPLPKGHPLLKHDNLLISPHMAWYSEESAYELKRKVAEEAARFVNGEAVQYSVIP